jgi:hypothetical protein
MHQASVPPVPSKRRINSMTVGPSCRQVLIQLDPMPTDSTFPAIVGSANCALSQVNLWVDFCFSAYGGIALHTNCVTSQPEMDLIGPAIARALSLETPVTAALPSSRSYLKIVDVPYFIAGSSNQSPLLTFVMSWASPIWHLHSHLQTCLARCETHDTPTPPPCGLMS